MREKFVILDTLTDIILMISDTNIFDAECNDYVIIKVHEYQDFFNNLTMDNLNSYYLTINNKGLGILLEDEIDKQTKVKKEYFIKKFFNE